MKLLANENIPGSAIEVLRAAGHDVAWVRTLAPGAGDNAVLDLARREERVLITFDKGFGELAQRAGLPRTSGIVLLRFRPTSAEQIGRTLIALLDDPNGWLGHFSVVEPSRVRRRALR